MLQRAAIVLLVVLNLGTAAWWWRHASPPAEAPVDTPAGAARLHLVAESSPAARTVAAESAGMDAARAGTPAVAPASAQPAPTSAVAALADAPPTPTQTPSAAATLCDGGTGPAPGWRVWLPPLPTAEAAQATAARIGEAGFSDYLVVRDGADANMIALGRYGSQEAAQRRTAALRASGFQARCARIPPATPA
jgi:hypothetical protein